LLLNSSLCKSPLGDDDARECREDNRFVDYYGTAQAIVTSVGTQESGMFEAKLDDD